MNLKNLPEITFAERSPTTIQSNIIALYESIAERTLAEADPIRLLLSALASIIVNQRAVIDAAAKENLLAYADGDFLDHLGVLVGVTRMSSTYARTTLEYTLAASRSVSTTIPKGNRVTADSQTFFATDDDLVIPAGSITGRVGATCTVSGAKGNGFAIGELASIVDPIAFVQSVTNVTASEGGGDAEKDDSLRTRIQEAPETFSTAGPEGAYKAKALGASTLIEDVSVDSPNPGEVVVYPILTGGEIPGEEMLNIVAETLNARDVRPLTDKLTVQAPEAVPYDVTLTYYIDREDATSATAIQEAVGTAIAAYIEWQGTKLGRDINPTELGYRIRAAGAKRVELTAPMFQTLAKNQIAKLGTKSVSFGGLEDG